MSDVPNMKTRAFQSIAVVGQLKTGKETICRLLGEKFASRKEEPRRYEITVPGAPRLQGYVLTIYSKLDHLNLDMPERTGIIVLTPEKIASLCAENRFRRHEQFFEMLQKLGWLGVKRYIVVVTHIYETEHHDIGWFETITRQFSHILRKHLGLRIRACVPVGRKNEHYWYNIHCSEPWYSGPCLVKALENLMAGQKQAPDSLWVVGTAIPTEKNNIFRVNAEKPSRGTFCHNSTVHVFLDNPDTPDELEGILKMDAEAEQSAPSSVQLYDGTLQQKSPVVLVSTTTPIQFPAVIKVDALLKDGLTLDELITTDLDVTFFGPYSKEGQIGKRPRLVTFYDGNPLPGQRTSLEIHMIRKPVIETFVKDPDAGRVLIWRKDQTRTSKNLIAVGRIVSFFDYETKHLIKLLMFLDQLQFTNFQEQYFLTREIEHLIHDAKRDAEMLQLRDIEQQIDNAHRLRKFERGIEHSIGRLNFLKSQPVFGEHQHLIDNVIRCLEEVKDQLCKSFLALEEEEDTEVVDERLNHIIRYYGDMKYLINRQTTRPIRKLVREVMRAFEEKETDFLYEVHDLLPQYVDYYPKEVKFSTDKNLFIGTTFDSIEEAIKDGLEELLRNSIKHNNAVRAGQDLRVDMFIDPPSIEENPEVKIWFQENGMLTEDIIERIRTSTRGWRDHKKRLEPYNVRLDVADCIGFGTTCILTIPVWDASPDMRQYTLNLAAVLQYLDYGQQQQTGVCPDYLGRLSEILHSSENMSVIETRILKLQAQSKQVMQSLPDVPGWVKRGMVQLDRLMYLLRSRPNDYIQQMKRLMQNLQQYPVQHLLQDVQNGIWNYLQKNMQSFRKLLVKEEILHIAQCDVPPYRLLQPASYRILRKTLAWGLKELIVDGEYCRNLQVEYRLSDNRKTMELLFTGPEIRHSFEQKLFPFRTRLANLGIENNVIGNTENILVLSIPIWIIPKEKRKYERGYA